MNFHVRNKRFLVQQQNSMAGARVLPLPPFAGKVYNLMVIGERIENEFSAKSGPLSEPQCICQKMFSAALSDTQMVLLRDLGTHSSVDCSFCKYFLNDSCRQKPQVRCVYAPTPGLTWPAACGSWDAGCRGGRGRWVQT